MMELHLTDTEKVDSSGMGRLFLLELSIIFGYSLC